MGAAADADTSLLSLNTTDRPLSTDSSTTLSSPESTAIIAPTSLFTTATLRGGEVADNSTSIIKGDPNTNEESNGTLNPDISGDESANDPANPTDATDDGETPITFHHAFGTITNSVDPASKANITNLDTTSVTNPLSASTSSESNSAVADVLAAPITQSSQIESKDVFVSSTSTPSPIPVNAAGTTVSPGLTTPTLLPTGLYTSGGTTYEISQGVSIFKTTLADGHAATTSVTFQTRLPVPTAESNSSDDSERGQYNPPGPVTMTPGESGGFFQKPAAATGVFVAVGLVIGSLWWMFILIRRHRRQAAMDAKRKRPNYWSHAYGATGFHPGDRTSYLSDDRPHWPEQFEAGVAENSPEIQLNSPPPPRNDASSYPSSSTVVENGREPAMGPILPLTRSASFYEIGFSRMASPPLSLRSPSSPTSSPSPTALQASVIIASPERDVNDWNFGYGSFPSLQTAPSTSKAPLSRSASANRPYPTKLSTIYDAIEPPVTPVPPSTPGRISPATSNDDPFRFSGYLVPSPTPSAELLGRKERLSNPFADAESPLQKTHALPYVREAGFAAQAAVLERGVSLRRNNTLREYPEHRLSTSTPDPSTAESGSSGTEAFNSTAPLRLRDPSDRPTLRKSESISTSETSVGNVNEIDDNYLFYNPDYASPIRTHPAYQDIR